jgi:hypothetical protein
MNIAFRNLTEIDPSEIVELMNHPALKRHMPLLGDEFTEEDCREFVAGKEQLWAEHGYGP